MPAPKKRPTAADVARLSGVSTATVSYVLNRTAGQTIPEATRDRVLAAARELGYVPSAVAQALARGTSRAVILDFSDLPYGERAADVLRVFATALRESGYIPVVNFLADGDEEHGFVRRMAAVLAPAAVITVTPLADPTRALIESPECRVISLLSTREALLESVAAAAAMQVRYLAERGHTVIGYRGSAVPELAEFSEARRRRAHDEAERLGLELHDLGAGTDHSDVLERLARTARPVTAIAAYNDEVAAALLGALHDGGHRVPDDIAVMGVDDLPLAEHLLPSLTTIRFGPDDDVAAADVVGMVEGRDLDVPRGVLPGVLVPRASA
ncbi:LacI family DNA-binding transcriptional regulator [Microbacterium sp. NPDC056044]|uniref:LacI family DNA-binding transcriptional regulator n=1 Tax=Microbacterium sp. NPDC056044 TaxID=3345690 RepID=UPI0035D7DCDD